MEIGINFCDHKKGILRPMKFNIEKMKFNFKCHDITVKKQKKEGLNNNIDVLVFMVLKQCIQFIF